MIVHANQKDFLMQVYSECNAHAREQPKFRDQVILFYSAVCAFYLSHLSQISKAMFFFLTFAMLMLGIVCALIVINFRSWIIQYGKAADVIGRLLISDQTFASLDDITTFIRDECQKSLSLKRPFFIRMGNLIVLGFCFITLAPFAAIYERLADKAWWVRGLILCSALVYFCILVYICWKQVDKAEQMNEKTWIIRFQLDAGAMSAPKRSHPADPRQIQPDRPSKSL